MAVNPATYSLAGLEVLVAPLQGGVRQREAERLCVKELIEYKLGSAVELLHYESGKPYLSGTDAEISISHTKGYAAIALSDKPIGIDIEYISDRVLRVTEKFISESEQALAAASGLDFTVFCIVCWSAKEAAFKKIGLQAVDFKEHLVIDQLHAGKIRMQIKHPEKNATLCFEYYTSSEFVLVAG